MTRLLLFCEICEQKESGAIESPNARMDPIGFLWSG